MQESKFIDRTDINSPSFSKHVTICFNEQADTPLQLIAYDDEKGFIVNPEAEKFFESLKDDKLGVIAMVGKNRTGKSSLLNRVILNRTSGFSVGHTINPCTKVNLIDLNRILRSVREYGSGLISLKLKTRRMKEKS